MSFHQLRLIRCSTFLAFLLLAPLLFAQRAIPDNNLGYPILVKFPDGSSGSGFFLRHGSSEYLVTAAHVLFQPKTPIELAREAADNAAKHAAEVKIDPLKLHSDTATLVSYSGDPNDLSSNTFALNLPTLLSAGKVMHHPIRDVAVVKIFSISKEESQPGGSFETQLEPGVNMLTHTASGFITLPESSVKNFSQVLVGNDTITFGYPSSIGVPASPQIDYDRPLLRKGIVAGLSPAARTIILDSTIFFGNSGGPVLELDRDTSGALEIFVIGVVVEYIPFQQSASSQTIGITLFANSGYSVALPMDFVLELLKN